MSSDAQKRDCPLARNFHHCSTLQLSNSRSAQTLSQCWSLPMPRLNSAHAELTSTTSHQSLQAQLASRWIKSSGFGSVCGFNDSSIAPVPSTVRSGKGSSILVEHSFTTLPPRSQLSLFLFPSLSLSSSPLSFYDLSPLLYQLCLHLLPDAINVFVVSLYFFYSSLLLCSALQCYLFQRDGSGNGDTDQGCCCRCCCFFSFVHVLQFTVVGVQD